MDKIKLSENLEMTRLVHGHWRLTDWNLTPQQLLTFTEKVIQMGITTFDHADIYGDYACEALFGNALKIKPALRDTIQIVTKCGIKLVSDKYPDRKVKIYDYSYEHIMTSVENSLKNLNTDRIDLLLLHRPSPFFNPEEVSKAFSELKKQGKVLQFGVSNFTPSQFEMLDQHLDQKLVTNQVEISPYCLEHFQNGNMDFFMKNNIKPMAWSPLAGGSIFNPSNDKSKRLHKTLSEVANELDIATIDQIIYSWILKHPSKTIPVIGSGKLERIQTAVDSLNIDMSLEQWFKIYNASIGDELP